MESPKFPRPLVARKTGDMLWTLVEEFWYYVGDPDDEDLIIVPIGFQYDFASTPRVLWQFYPPDGRWTYPSTIHDFCYFMQTRTRKECDLILWEGMKEVGCGPITRNNFYNACRLFGWAVWNKRARELRKNG